MPKSPISKKVRLAVFERDGGVCQYCGAVCSSVNDHTLDHVTPIALGGGHDANNLRTACKACNCSKKNQTIDEFRFSQTVRNSAIGNIISSTQAAALIAAGIELNLPPLHVFFFEKGGTQ